MRKLLPLAAWLALAALAPAQAGSPAAEKSALSQVRFDQNLDAPVPLTLPFRDESGRTVPLGRYFGQRPVILTLVYFECPMLCTESLNGLVRTLRSISLNPGKDFNLVTVSFDPSEKPALAAAKKSSYVERYGRPTAKEGWAFLTGDAEPIKRLADAVGFHYAYDPELKQFAHATGVVVLTPQGKIAQYFYGVEYPPRDMRLAGGATVLLMAMSIGFFLWWEKTRAAA